MKNLQERLRKLERELRDLRIEVKIHKRVFLRSKHKEEIQDIMDEEREKLHGHKRWI